MSTAALPAPIAANVGDVDHLYCCDPDVAMCGLDLTGVPEGREFTHVCPLCAEVNDSDTPCPVAGCEAAA